MVCRAWGAPDVLQLENVPSRALRPGEVRIRVRAAGVNFADSLMVGGTYQVKPPFPFTPGLEAAGEVIETGDGVPGLRTGQRVLAVLRNGGGYAEEIVLNAATVLPIPATMDFVTAAAFPVAYGTSHFALTHRGHLQSGETLLVLGAAGGVGLTAVEIGKALGARVIAAAGGVPTSSRSRDRAVPTNSSTIATRPGARTYRRQGRRRRLRPRRRRRVRPGATRSQLGGADAGDRFCLGADPSGASQSDPGQEHLGGRRRLGRPYRASPRVDEPRPRRTLALVGDGKLKPLIAKTFPLAEAGAALDALVSRRYAGKVVLET